MPDQFLTIQLEEPCGDASRPCPKTLGTNSTDDSLSNADLQEIILDVLTDQNIPHGVNTTFDIDLEKVRGDGPGTISADREGCPCTNPPKDKLVPVIRNVNSTVKEPEPPHVELTVE